MTQSDKELLLRDLCARLPYGVHVEISWEYSKTDVYTSLEYYEFPNIDSLLNIFWDEKCISIKPYLRPLSSMTEEEREELSDYLCEQVMSNKIGITIPPNPTQGKGIPFIWMGDCLDWLNEHHFDYRSLIEKGLALEAPEDLYN